MIPDDNLLNAKIHEALGKPICVESGVVYEFSEDEMRWLPDYCDDRNLLPEVYSLLCPGAWGTFIAELVSLAPVEVHDNLTLQFRWCMSQDPMWQVACVLKALGQWPDNWQF